MAPRRVQCGKPDCYRQYRNKRCREYGRANRERTYTYGRTTYQRECVICGEAFTTRRKDGKFCGAGSYCEVEGRGQLRGINQDKALASWTAELFAPALPGTRAGAEYRRALRRDPCAYCGETPSNGLDHIEPKSEGGSRIDLDNLTGCCHLCNSTKRTLPLLIALIWIPISREYHLKRRAIFT